MAIMILISMLFDLLPPTDVRAFDKPNDAGSNIIVTWMPSPDDSALEGYAVTRNEFPDTVSVRIGSTMRSVTSFEDGSVQDGKAYVYRVAAVREGELSYSEPSGIAASHPQVFHGGRINILISILLFTSVLMVFVVRAKRGIKFFIRKIAGLEAVEEAVGRATEMGRPVLFVPGLGDIDYTATIASMNILGEIAKKIAMYETPLIAVNCYPVVYTVSKEVVQQAYISQGKPDKFRDDYVRYLTESQFGYAAAINGIILREKPATNFFIGSFFAEALLMAETGAQTGAIQIAGTDQVLQLPFFVTACDYTLLGEEVYAASAYLSREPLLVGSLKAQDFGKLAALIILLGFSIFSFFKLNLLSMLRVQ
jgi:hypothetical protein